MSKTTSLHLSMITGLCLVLMAALVVGADPPIDPNLERLKALPLSERKKLLDNLNRFDKLPRADQQRVLDLDRLVSQLDQKTDYLGVLRRYHNWFESLPEAKRQQLRSAPPENRMNLVSRFMDEQKRASAGMSPQTLLKLLDLGSFSPVETAMIYKTWRKLGPAGRSKLEKAPLAQFRGQIIRQEMKSDVDEKHFIPPGYSEATWIAKIKQKPRLFPVEIPAKKEAVREEFIRRLALNLYFLDHPPKSVTDDNLALFLAELPESVRSTFDLFPPGEAKRRLTISYRLIYPTSEIPAPSKTSPTGTAAPKPPATPKTQTTPGPAKPELIF